MDVVALASLLNTSKIFSGVSMLLINLGSRHVIADLGIAHEKILTNEYVKVIIILAMFFVATRDIIISFCLTVLYIIIVDGLLHEKRPFSLIPERFKAGSPSKKEYDNACDVINKYKKINQELENKKSETYQNYLKNIKSI